MDDDDSKGRSNCKHFSFFMFNVVPSWDEVHVSMPKQRTNKLGCSPFVDIRSSWNSLGQGYHNVIAYHASKIDGLPYSKSS